MFGGGDEVFVVVGASDLACNIIHTSTYMRTNKSGHKCPHLVQLLIKLIQLRRLRHRILVHHERRLNLLVPAFPQKVEPVRDERLVEVDAVVGEVVSSVTRDLGAWVCVIVELASVCVYERAR